MFHKFTVDNTRKVYDILDEKETYQRKKKCLLEYITRCLKFRGEIIYKTLCLTKINYVVIKAMQNRTFYSKGIFQNIDQIKKQ